MGASICGQLCVNNNHELMKEQIDPLPQNFDSKQVGPQVQPKENLLPPKILPAIVCTVIPDEPASKEQSSLDYGQEVGTPYLPYNDHCQNGEYQVTQMLQEEICQSNKIQSQLQSEHKLQQYQQQSKFSYPKNNNEEYQRLVNLQIVEDNLDDYINYDWKNSQFQLINIGDQNSIKKSIPIKQSTKQNKKQFQ